MDYENHSASQLLREARLGEGWELELVSQQTKIPVEFLRHIEDGAWDRLPGAVYARAFVRTLAGLYGLDQDLIVKMLRTELNLDREVVNAPPSEQITNFSQTREDPQVPAQKPVGMMVAMGVIVVVLGTVLYFTRTPTQMDPVPVAAVDSTALDTLALDTVPTPSPAPVTVVAGAHIRLQDSAETVTVLCLREKMVTKKTFHGRDSLVIPRDTVLTLRNLSGKFLRLSGSHGRDSLGWKFLEAGSVGDSFWVKEISESQWSKRYDAIVGKEKKRKKKAE